MKEIYYTYNNEAIASCVLLSAIQQTKAIDIARSCLILPFLLDDRTVRNLQSRNAEEMNLENFIKEQPRLFSSFNKRYLALLPISINSLLLLNKSNQIQIAANISSKSDLSFADANLGDRYNKIGEALPNLLNMLKEYSTPQLYQLLKIQL
jgi:hypothetical protein